MYVTDRPPSLTVWGRWKWPEKTGRFAGKWLGRRDEVEV